MAKFGRLAKILGRGRTLTHEGGAAYRREPKNELFLLAVTNFVGEDTFYETAAERDSRFTALVAKVTAEDPEWITRFVPWLRRVANLRSAAIVVAVEYIRAGGQGGRAVISSALARADEPGEVFAYWTTRYGRAIPKPVKRGVADAATRLWNERSALKYDGKSRAWRLADVLELAHVRPRDQAQSELFRWLLDRRHGRAPQTADQVSELLPVIREWTALQAMPASERGAVLDAERLAGAGVTWEAMSGLRDGPMDAAAWEALVPSMGYMALLRNLRNFDEAGVSDRVAEAVAQRLADPQEVARSRQLPFRFLSAHLATSSVRWTAALERALDAAVQQLPVFEGRTLVLVDTSGSMSQQLSGRSSATVLQVAALFGVALAVRGQASRGNETDLVGFADRTFRHRVSRGASVLREVERFTAKVGSVGYGTQIAEALGASYRGQRRVVLLSDMQAFPSGQAGRQVATGAVPANVPVYAFNVAGYAPTVLDAGGSNRHEFGGLSDATFGLIGLLERAESADWPF